MSAAAAAKVVKDSSMLKQKEMISGNYRRLETAAADGRKVVSTFVPGNLNELIMCFDVLNNLPEINAIQNGLRKRTGAYIVEAEKRGHSEDVCTYVKADLGMIAKGNLGPDGQKLPDPDLLLLSYTGCFTFMKWFELLRERYNCETAMLHVPYQGDGKISRNMVSYVVKQLKEEVIPKLERVSGVKFDIDRLRENLARSAQAEEDFVWVLESAKAKPSPIDAYFGGVYYIGPIFTAFRGTEDAIEYYGLLRAEIAERLATCPMSAIGWWWKVRPTGPASATSGRCSMRKARWWSPAPTPRSAGCTTRASAMTRIIRWKASPSTASAATPTATCPRASA